MPNNEDYTEKTWYCNTNSRARATEILNLLKYDAKKLFLVRKSHKNEFAVSIKLGENCIRHFIIGKSSGKYSLKPEDNQFKRFDSLNELINYYMEHEVMFKTVPFPLKLEKPYRSVDVLTKCSIATGKAINNYDTLDNARGLICLKKYDSIFAFQSAQNANIFIYNSSSGLFGYVPHCQLDLIHVKANILDEMVSAII